MKELFIKISKICLIVFCICMAIFAILALSMKDKTQGIPDIFMLLFIISLGGAFIGMMVCCALSVIEDIKAGKKFQLMTWCVVILVCSLGYTLWQRHQGIENFNGLFFLIRLLLIGGGMKAGVYIFQGKK